jgi:methionyl-tRNA formyltransferase
VKIVFMGTPEFAVPTLTEIVARGHEVAAVYTRAPKPAGRGQAERKSPVHEAAEGFGIPVLTPRSLKSPDEQAAFAAHDADVAVVVAYGLILPPPSSKRPPMGCLNLHGSLLPRWRGAAPIQRAVMAGDSAHRRHGDEDGRGPRHRPRRRWSMKCPSAPTKPRAISTTA